MIKRTSAIKYVAGKQYNANCTYRDEQYTALNITLPKFDKLKYKN